MEGASSRAQSLADQHRQTQEYLPTHSSEVSLPRLGGSSVSTPLANYRFSLISAGPARSTPRLRSLSPTRLSFPFAAFLSCVLVGNTGSVACVGASVERS